jgi:hypothetical protein
MMEEKRNRTITGWKIKCNGKSPHLLKCDGFLFNECKKYNIIRLSFFLINEWNPF